MNFDEQIRFDKAWNAVHGKLAAHFFRQGCPEGDVHELVQETAYRACKNYGMLKGDFNPWIFGIARYVFIDYIRGRKRTAELEDEDTLVDPHTDTDEQAINRTVLAQCLSSLDELDRKCLILHDRDGYNYKKIGQMLGISTSNAHYRVEKARGSLRDQFSELVQN